MQYAIDSAKEGIIANHGGPFGACIVKNNKLISVAHNTVIRDHDPTCHAEMNAIRQACKVLGTQDLTGTEIYTTAEPCPMCFCAIYWANVSKIWVGVSKDCAALYGFRDDFFYEQLLLPPNQRQIPCEFGIKADECKIVFQEWKDLERPLY